MGSINGCRSRCSLSMAGWSMVADDEDAVHVCNNLQPNKSLQGSGFEKTIKELISLFRHLLDSFLREFCSAVSLPMTGDGRPVDLFNLFLNVSHKGGLDAVSENGSWDEIAQESGFGFNNSVSAESIYVKYLDAFARLLNRGVAGDTNGTSVEFSGISDDLVTRLNDFLSQVKTKYERRKGKAAKELGAELKWFISKTKIRFGLHQIGKEYGSNDALKDIQGSKMTEKTVENLIILDAGGNQGCSSPGKRKRECPLETLKWLTKVAKDPSDPSIGRLPDKSMWESYGSEEPWKQLIMFRDSRRYTDSISEKSWQKIQKMHPSLYEGSAGPSYNLRERLSLNGSQMNEKKAGKGKTSSGSGSASHSSDSDEEDRPCALVGSEFQAEVPEWTGITSVSDPKWLGTRIWPLSKELNNRNRLIERDPIGKGRQDPCGCQNPGSIECVRFHITTKQEKLKLELGPAFYAWCFDVMGEGTVQYWTEYERKTMNALMTYPPTLSPSLFEQLKSILGYKSRGKVVSYFYNVILLQFRANQSRISPYEADSDTDQLYDIAIANEDPTPDANNFQKPAMLTPKRKRRR